MNQGGDRGKSPNKTGTQPTGKAGKSNAQAAKKAGKGGAGPKKTEARTTKKSRDK